MIQERNMSVLLAAAALASLVEQPPRADSTCMTHKPSERKIKPLTFPQKLMQVLSSEEYSNIIIWLPNGRSFAIINPKEFVSIVLPAHFKRVKYSSFTRKLQRWGFERKTRGEEAGAFCHKLFLRDNAELCTKMSMSKSDVGTTDKIHISSTPFLDRSLRESEKHGYEKHRPDPKNRESIQRQSLRVTPEEAPKQQAPELCLSKSVGPGFIDNRMNIPIDRNMLDQFILSRRLRAINRSTALSGHALMSLQNPFLLGDQKVKSVDGAGNAGHIRTTSPYFNKNYKKGNSTPTGVDAAQNGVGKGKALSLGTMAPPSA